jgi:hypothetical protein
MDLATSWRSAAAFSLATIGARLRIQALAGRNAGVVLNQHVVEKRRGGVRGGVPDGLGKLRRHDRFLRVNLLPQPFRQCRPLGRMPPRRS